ncbi:MAG: ABC transporter ATP-binding protein [Cyanobacteria bacterium RM1_2_2]|nr:ABC transporter ATP-binding protein [Cyanobacteria bacterium RM1_2_2]
MKDSSVVLLDHVSKIYPTAKGEFYAVRDVTIEVQPGEFYSLLGSSGSGKTTTLRLIGGFEIPEYGQVWISGEDVTTLPPYRRNVHTVFQSYALFPHLTVAQNIAYPLVIAKVPKAEIAPQVEEALRMFQITGLGDRRPSQLSGGQQQRVALARALISRPKVLLLDEPLSALDAKIREEVRQELRALQRQTNLTFVYVTHDQEEALALSDRIAVMHNGQVEQIGSPKTIYNRPASLFVAQFIGKANFFTGEVVAQQADLLQVNVAGTLVKATAPTHTPVLGETVTLMIRPEQVQIRAAEVEPNPRLTQISGKTTAVTYVGQLLQIQIETAVGSLMATQLSGSDPAGAVTLSWTADHCIVISPSE